MVTRRHTDRHAAWRPRWRLSRRVRRARLAQSGDTVHQRHSCCQPPLHRHRAVRLRDLRGADMGGFSGLAGDYRAGTTGHSGGGSARQRICCAWYQIALREAAFALGTPKWRVIMTITLKCRPRSGVATGVLLAVARISGETAPLLFTALSNQFWNVLTSIKPMANLPVTIFKFAMSPFQDSAAARLGWRVPDHDRCSGPQHHCCACTVLQTFPINMLPSIPLPHAISTAPATSGNIKLARTQSELLLRQISRAEEYLARDSREEGHRVHRTIGMWQIDFAAHLQSYVRAVSGSAGGGRDQHGWRESVSPPTRTWP